MTLGTLSLYRGLTFIMSDAKQIDRQFVPSALKSLSQTSPIFGIPWIIFISFGVVLLDLVVRHAHPHRAADLCARIQPGGGAAARHRRHPQ